MVSCGEIAADLNSGRHEERHRDCEVERREVREAPLSGRRNGENTGAICRCANFATAWWVFRSFSPFVRTGSAAAIVAEKKVLSAEFRVLRKDKTQKHNTKPQ